MKKAEVVIIGGGIQGISLAYHLAKKGLTGVCLLEMNTLGSGSSGRSAAIIGHAFPTEECLPLLRLSCQCFQNFQDELEKDPCYEKIGCLVLAGDYNADFLKERQVLLKKMDVDSQLVEKEEILKLCPGLNLDDIERGLYNGSDGSIDPHSIMMGYSGAARRLGVEFCEGVHALGLILEGDRIKGVTTTDETIMTPCVVNAAGFRAREVASWAGTDLPISNLKRHIFVTGPIPFYAGSIPFTYDMEAGWYIRREGPGLLIGMGEEPSQEEDPQVDWAFLDVVSNHTLKRVPVLADAGIKDAWAGIRPVTPDDNPILGPSALVRGFYNDCGWGGHGIMHAPAAGMALAEWIIVGKPGIIDLSPFSDQRFS
jgi:sarcosine oxidase subunit beta